MKRFILAFALLGLSIPLAAQQRDQPAQREAPAGPLLKRAPEFASWTITINRSGVSAANADGSRGKKAAAELQQLAITKTKNIYREERQFSDGSKLETWRIGSMQISERPGTGEIVIFEPTESMLDVMDEEAYTDYSKTDFPDLGWVSIKNYAGIQKIKEAQCMMFSSASSAWINLETRLPVVVQIGNKNEIYTFGKAPDAMLALPVKIQSFLDRRAKALQMLTAAPARPY